MAVESERGGSPSPTANRFGALPKHARASRFTNVKDSVQLTKARNLKAKSSSPLSSITSDLSKPSTSANVRPLTTVALFWLSFLAVQFGFQSLLVRVLIPSGTDKVSLVLGQEGVKIIMCFLALHATSSSSTSLSSSPPSSSTTQSSISSPFKGWSLGKAVAVAGVPAVIYAVQNVLTQLAMAHLDPVTFNMVNQSKLLSTALFTYIICNKRQSSIQILALVLLAAATMSLGVENANHGDGGEGDSAARGTTSTVFLWGFVPCILASICSGFASALCQLALQGQGRNSFLYSMELAFFTSLTLLGSSYVRFITEQTGGITDVNGLRKIMNLTFSSSTPVAFVEVCL